MVNEYQTHALLSSFALQTEHALIRYRSCLLCSLQYGPQAAGIIPTSYVAVCEEFALSAYLQCCVYAVAGFKRAHFDRPLGGVSFFYHAFCSMTFRRQG